MAQGDEEPMGRKGGLMDGLATKLADKTEHAQKKVTEKTGRFKDEKRPGGGYDNTPIPKSPPGYTLKFTFHRASNLPAADLPSFSSDPYVDAKIRTALPRRHKQDPPLRFRTPTIRRNTNPEWNSEWIVANVPSSGFSLKARLYDEDATDHDDRLGNAYVDVNSVDENWEGIRYQGFRIKKRHGSKRAYFVKGCAAVFNRHLSMSGKMFISVEVLGRTEAESGGKMYTLGPCNWSQHFSPTIGRLAGVKGMEKGKDGKSSERYE